MQTFYSRLIPKGNTSSNFLTDNHC